MQKETSLKCKEHWRKLKEKPYVREMVALMHDPKYVTFLACAMEELHKRSETQRQLNEQNDRKLEEFKKTLSYEEALDYASK